MLIYNTFLNKKIQQNNKPLYIKALQIAYYKYHYNIILFFIDIILKLLITLHSIKPNTIHYGNYTM